MDSDRIEKLSAATVTFEQELERLILGSFARGVTVAGTWEIDTPLAETPNWIITIERTDADEQPPDHAGVIEK